MPDGWSPVAVCRKHLKFAVVFWQTMKGNGSNPLGGNVHERPWNRGGSAMDIARYTLDAAFEFFSKLTVPLVFSWQKHRAGGGRYRRIGKPAMHRVAWQL